MSYVSLIKRSILCNHINLSFKNLCTEFRSCPEETNQPFNPSEDSFEERAVPKTYEEFFRKKNLLPYQPANPHFLKVAIIGEPNAGKSTLINSLIGWRVCSVSKKVHTTKHKAAAILVKDDTQVVFLDTPGLVTPSHGKKHNLDSTLVVDPKLCLQEADLIGVVVDVTNMLQNIRLHPLLVEMLEDNVNTKSVLIMNKVDAFKKKGQLLEIAHNLTVGKVNKTKSQTKEVRTKLKENVTLNRLFQKTESKLKELEEKQIRAKESDAESKSHDSVFNSKVDNVKNWPNFSEVFMISALREDGTDKLREYLLSSAKSEQWKYDRSIVTDQNPHEMALMIVREKFLDLLPKEIPYSLGYHLEMWELDPSGHLKIVIVINCPKKNYVKLILGPSGKNISKLAEMCRQEICNAFQCDVFIKLMVNYKKM